MSSWASPKPEVTEHRKFIVNYKIEKSRKMCILTARLLGLFNIVGYIL